MDLRIRAANGSIAVVHATQHHLFWNPVKHAWIEADKLASGDALLAAGGAIAHVVASTVIPGSSGMWDLSVAGTHDFYVGNFGVTTALVHNCPRPPSLTPGGAGRSGAFNQAKVDAGVPTSQQPDSVGPNVNRQGTTVPGRIYTFTGADGNEIEIRDDAGGHEYPDDPTQNRGPHFNGPNGEHYDY